MNRITEITKGDILDLFRNGLVIDDFFETKTVKYYYFGRLKEIDFLKRIYDLKNMQSSDSRFKDAEADIKYHIENNDDYLFGWVFEDERFELKNGTDEKYLEFICEIFHPAVRDDRGYWKEFLIEINKLLQNDGYEICPVKKVSNRDVYGWKMYQKEENDLFIPYSQRHEKAIKSKRITLSINKKARNQIYQFLERNNREYKVITETGFNYNTTVSENVFDDIRQFYIPRCYNTQNEYIETTDLQNFILSNSPFCVLDAIEFFYRYRNSDNFESQINSILRLNELSLKLENGKISKVIDIQMNKNLLSLVQEVGLKELLQEAEIFYDNDNLQIAVEKLWDAFERLKTYYCSTTIDKKESANKIVIDISNNQQPFIDLFEKEFHELTSLGNNFRIRHHETTKTDIQDKRHYEYFYKRCLSLVSTAIQYLEG